MVYESFIIVVEHLFIFPKADFLISVLAVIGKA